MSIYIDVSAAVHRRAGLGRYGESLTRALVAMVPERIALFCNQERGVDPLEGLGHLPARTVSLGYKPWRMAIWAGQLGRLPFNRLVPGAELFHATEHLLMPLRGVPTVLTIHDLIPQLLPEHHKPLNRWYLTWTMPLYCRRANHIIAVSEATRQDLLALYDLPAEKVSVIHEAASPRFRPQPTEDVDRVRSAYGLPETYVLYVGTIEPRKNLLRLLEAWTPLRQAGEAPPLVIVGKRGWLSEAFYSAVEANPVRDDIVLTGYLADGDLPAVYAGATAFLWPSVYEGFGLPPLEAMACGTPVVCSDASSMPEVVGDAAMLFDPRDTGALSSEIRRIVSDVDLRSDLVKRGLARAARFSWAETARQTIEVYEETLGHPV